MPDGLGPRPLAALQSEVDQARGTVARLRAAVTARTPVTPAAELELSIATLQKADPGLPRHKARILAQQARAKTLSANPQLYRETHEVESVTVPAVSQGERPLDAAVRALRAADPLLSRGRAIVLAVMQYPELYEG